ncbi:hypothetical protein, partial [Klebsiella pneumoniae]|uniref:hypothetical protein n=1 Tax=Klebsiella pneumoniae TaxID=573 RepID=UPI001C47DE80
RPACAHASFYTPLCILLFHYQTLLNKIECRPDSSKAVGKINQKACHPLSFSYFQIDISN